MRHFLPPIALLLLAGCGDVSRTERRAEDLKTYEAEDAAAPPAQAPASPPPTQRMSGPQAAPDISPTAAPGVAFNYRYAFRLPAERIGPVQEQHARACEQLGISRCRITGMRYRVVNERDVEAMLAFKLEPSIARRFGQAGADLVTRSEGMLVDSEISGTDVGTTIRAAGRNIAEMTEELERLEARLRQRIPAEERSRLEFEAQQLRQSIRANRASREDQQESLATTPMVFQYGSGELVPGFDDRPTLSRAAERAVDNLVQGVAILVILLVTLLPWALLGLIGWGIYRLVQRRRRRRAIGETGSAVEAPLS